VSRIVVVLGGGVVGLTTAVHLELAGYETRVHTARLAHERPLDPTLASPYAAASVKPASVTMADLPRVLAASQDAFGLLAASGAMGVRRQPHHVCHERDHPDPEYAGAVEGFCRLSEVDDHPRRPGADAVYGWRFDAYFAEMPVYLRRLLGLYRALGGTVTRRRVDREDLPSLPGDVLVNCLGYAATDVFDDPRPFEAHLGHQVVARGLPPVRDGDGRPFSYNYTTAPDAAVPAGEVYAYPRTDALVLGGNRVPVDVAPGEDWDGSPDEATRTLDGVDVPARLVGTNAVLLEEYAGVDLRAGDLSGRYGYRPVRDPDGEGVRVERETVAGRPVVHHYGHGGAGVTLSWGSAAEAAGLVREVVAPDPGPVEPGSEFAVAERLAALVRG
jgi:D-amino-acid oxidase